MYPRYERKIVVIVLTARMAWSPNGLLHSRAHRLRRHRREDHLNSAQLYNPEWSGGTHWLVRDVVLVY